MGRFALPARKAPAPVFHAAMDRFGPPTRMELFLACSPRRSSRGREKIRLNAMKRLLEISGDLITRAPMSRQTRHKKRRLKSSARRQYQLKNWQVKSSPRS